ncbi:MAG: TonB-dependent receptor [Kiritimatiellae bacterium]|nr:TonB-dependent receptor [Kiritimatiellia bacterium]
MLEYIASNIDAVVGSAATWGFVLIFVFMAIESSLIPFPSEVVMIPAGFLAARGEMGVSSPYLALALAVLIGTAGALAGAYFNYAIALWAGKPFLEKYGKYFFLKKEALDRACEVFNRYGAATTFVCRLIPAIRQIISIPAGVSRMPLGVFSLFTFLGAGIWSAILALVGFVLARSAGEMSYKELVVRGAELSKEHLPWVIAAVVALVAVYYFISRLVMSRKGGCKILFFVLSVSLTAAYSDEVANLGTVEVEGTAISKYRPETVSGGTFTDIPPEKLPCVVDTLTSDFIQERNPTDLHDLLRYVPGIETGGKSLLIRQPGTFSVRGMGGTEPMFDGVVPLGRGSGLFMDSFLMDRVEIVKGPIAGLSGGSGSVQNASGGGGSVNLYLKSAQLEDEKTVLQGNSSVGKHTQRYRGMFDRNSIFLDGKAAFRLLGTADYYEPTYINQGVQKGARARESFTLAPSFVFEPNDDVRFGLKTMFQYTDQPSYIGVPVWRGRPAGGFEWYESSCRRGDRSVYESFMVNPWVDWQVSEDWLLKFGASILVSSWEQSTREPYSGRGAELESFFATGEWYSGNQYQISNFSNSSSVNRNYNLYLRSVYDTEIFRGVRSALVIQPDYNYRESSGGFGTPTSRYGLTLQDSLSWGWVTLLGGARYDHFESEAYTSGANRFFHSSADAVSPRGGVTVQPLDWLVFFGNVSQTRTPMLGLRTVDGVRPETDPWESTQFEGGLRLKMAKKLWLSLSAYRIEQENVPQIDNTGLVESYEGHSVSRGYEASLTGEVTDNWTFLGMYAYNRYTDRDKPHDSEARDFERYPRHTFSLNTSYRFSSGIFKNIVFGGGYRFRSMNYACMRGTFQNKNLRFDPSHVLDVNMAIPFSKFGGSDNWTLTLGVRNLLGEKYFESTRHYYECLVGEPRTFEVGIRAEF